jgi:predicted transposase/invertase (TIGR01784 family)
LCEEYLRRQKDKKNSEKTLPVIYPVIFYTGKNKYSAPRSFYELFENAELAKKFFEEPVKVIDIHQIKDENLKNSYLDTMLYICKHIYAKNILKWILIKRINFEIIAKNNFQYMKDMLLYIMQAGETDDTEELVSVFQKIVPENKKGNVMTIAERLRAEGITKGKEVGMQIGIEKGKLEGKLEIAKNLLAKGLDEQFVSETTGLTIQDIKKLRN